ncbi:MAG: Holliday junction branch migration protein RuvA [Bacteroidota bacterium]
MITHLSGKLIEKNPTYLIVECHGVGYFLNISLHTFSLIPDEENLTIYTHLQIKEDSHTLFGFMERVEREIFLLLIAVSGVGPSIARTMLSSLSPTQVRDAIGNGDVATMQAVKGIGAKTAQRIIVELKDKVLKIADMGELCLQTNNTTKEEALSALEVLGFNRKQSEKIVDRVLLQDPSLSVEAIIKQALKNL